MISGDEEELWLVLFSGDYKGSFYKLYACRYWSKASANAVITRYRKDASWKFRSQYSYDLPSVSYLHIWLYYEIYIKGKIVISGGKEKVIPTYVTQKKLRSCHIFICSAFINLFDFEVLVFDETQMCFLNILRAFTFTYFNCVSYQHFLYFTSKYKTFKKWQKMNEQGSWICFKFPKN